VVGVKRVARPASRRMAGRAQHTIFNGVQTRIAGFVALASLLFAVDARGNGAFPGAGQLFLVPGEPEHVVARTTFGIIVSRDGGASWRWVCESAMGYQNVEPPIGVTADGSVLVALEDGLRAGAGDLCNWPEASGIDAEVWDVSVQRDDPTVAVAVTTDLDTAVTRLWESTDRGASFTQAGVDVPGLYATTLDVAPSDPNDVYIAGSGTMGEPLVARTSDRGRSWTLHPIPVDTQSKVPFLSAIDPVASDTVYVRIAGDPGRLLASNDGGASWTIVFQATGPLLGFALSPDGETVLLGDLAGVWRAPTATMQFEKRSNVVIQCLAWTANGVYGCGNQLTDGFLIGLSTNEAATFEPVLPMHCVAGPLACEAGSQVQSCEAEWPALAEQLATDLCIEGAGGMGGAGSTTGGPANGAGGSTAAPSASPGEAPEGCTCRAGGAGRGRAPLAIGLAALVLGRLRRRRRAGVGRISDRCAP
jgi:photosystem II stability/assembly factor-like uncharacterized protein